MTLSELLIKLRERFLKDRTLSPVVERFMDCAREVSKSLIRTNPKRKRQFRELL
jgi:hypothetical protein